MESTTDHHNKPIPEDWMFYEEIYNKSMIKKTKKREREFKLKNKKITNLLIIYLV